MSVATAHIEPSEPDEVDVAQGRWHGSYRLYGERVRFRGTHVHFGEGPEICTGVERGRGAQGFGCGFFPKAKKKISVGWGTECGPHPSGYEAGAAKPGVAKVVAIFTDGERLRARLYHAPEKLRFDGQFWLSIHRGAPKLREVRAFGRKGRLIHREKHLDQIGDGCE